MNRTKAAQSGFGEQCSEQEELRVSSGLVAILVGAFCLLSAFGARGQGVLFSEIHSVPAQGLDGNLGQWFELFNGSNEAVDLGGCKIQAGQGGMGPSISVEPGTLVAPMGFLLFGASKAYALNGGIPVDYAWGAGLSLGTTTGFLRLICGDELVDEVVYGPEWGLVPLRGVSICLEPSAWDSQSNDDVRRWCHCDERCGNELFEVFGSPAGGSAACDSDLDGLSEDEGDCDDFDEMILPGMVERCNGLDDNCNGQVDEDPLIDRPTVSTLGACAESEPVCMGASGYGWEQGGSYEEDEVTCDGIDNDCDGFVDEFLLNACGQCGPAPLDLCDGVDNDCDGTVDEDAVKPEGFSCPGAGVGVCLGVAPVCWGSWTCPYPSSYEKEESRCDGLDNDCDGQVDEGFNVGGPCTAGIGGCMTVGALVCKADGSGTACAAEENAEAKELCGDNVDNDCDGVVDEGFDIGSTCYAGVGICRSAGKNLCSADGLSSYCSAVPMPAQEEICDNDLDDDCDGVVDEYPCMAPPNSDGVGCSTRGEGPGEEGRLPGILLALGLALLLAATRLVASGRFKGGSGAVRGRRL